MTNNAGFNCNAAKVLIMHEGWSQKTQFMEMLKSVLAHLPRRVAYYPGAFDRYDRFSSAHGNAIAVGDATTPCCRGHYSGL